MSRCRRLPRSRASQTGAGVVVNEMTIMRVSAVYSCVALIGGSIASMPIDIYELGSNGAAKVDTRANVRAADIWWRLNEQFDLLLTAAVAWEYVMWSKLLHGDGFIWIIRSNRFSSDIEGLVPLHPLDVDVQLEDGQLFYTFHDPREEFGKLVTVNQADMLHFPGIGYDGRRGMSLISHAGRNQAGIALAADSNQARFFGNSARPDYILEFAGGNLDPEQVDKLRKTIEETHGGPDRSWRPMILSGGLTAKPLTMSSKDAEILETRKFQVIDIARIFGVPPHMIGETEKTSAWGTGIESMSIGFVKYTLQRHFNKIQQEINRKLFPRTLRWFARFNPDGLLRGDSASRSQYYQRALGGNNGPGWMTQDEVRREENRMALGGQASELTQWSQKNATAQPEQNSAAT
jgi:HK97 family phage portal protein